MLDSKVALVTGGSRGLGRAIAVTLAKAGADVAILYAGNQSAAAETVAEIEGLGRKALAIQCDISDFEASKAAVEKVIETLGGVDILVNNAGITRDALVLSMKPEDFDRVVDTNLKGAFYMIKHVYSHLMKKRAGRIINISSVAGIMGNAGQANYASAKAGMIGLTKSVAKELAARGITCNAVAPGFIETDMTEVLSDKVKEAALASIPMRKMGKPADVANLVLFLASPNAGYLTGEVIKIDGGLCI